MMTPEQKREFLKLVEDGMLPSVACAEIGLTWNHIWAAEQKYPRFKAALKKAKAAGLAQRLEETLFKLARGQSTTETRLERPLYDEFDNPILDEQGRHKFKIVSRKTTTLAPDAKALKDWLSMSRPEDWAADRAAEPTVDDLTPEQVKEALQAHLDALTPKNDAPGE